MEGYLSSSFNINCRRSVSFCLIISAHSARIVSLKAVTRTCHTNTMNKMMMMFI